MYEDVDRLGAGGGAGVPMERGGLRQVDGPDAGKRKLHAESDRVELSDLIVTLWQRRYIVISCTVLCVAVAFIIVGRITPEYTARAKVLLDDRGGQVSIGREVVADLDLSNPVMESEVAAIMSNVLLGDVVGALGAERLRPIDPAGGGIVLARLVSSAEADGAGPVGDDLERLTRALKRRVTAQRDGQAYVIAITVETPDPALSADIANAVAETYVARQLAERQDTARRATLWLDTRVRELRKQVESAEAAVENYRADQIVLDGSSLETFSQTLVTYTNQVAEARAERAGAEARYGQIETLIAQEGPEAAADVLTSPLVLSLREQRARIAGEEAVLATRYEPGHVTRVRLRAEMARIDEDLAREVASLVATRRSELEVARMRERAMQENLGALEERLVEISRRSIEQRQLEREAAAVRQNYEELLSRLSETRTQEALQEADGRIIERAMAPTEPSAPRTRMLLAMGGVTGTALGFGMVFFVELAGAGFSSARQVEEDTGAPAPVVLPRVGHFRGPRDAHAALVARPNGLYAERIRHLRTALARLPGGGEARSVLVTSSLPDEGKTATALALAQMQALAGRSTVIVDCDVRRAGLQTAFGWEMPHDFAALVRGDCSLDEAIYRPDGFDFDVLAPNRREPRLADQFSTGAFRALVDALAARYDSVIIDAPPILAVSDAAVLGAAVDACLYLVKWRDTPRKAVRQGLAALAEAGAPLPHVVLSQVQAGKAPETYLVDYA